MNSHALCSWFSSTNMDQLVNFNTTTDTSQEWKCSPNMQPLTPPCGQFNLTRPWYGIKKCSDENYPTYIVLNNENLKGTLSTTFNTTYLGELVKFEIPYNSLSGSIPITLLLLPRLKYIDLGYNDFTGPLLANNMPLSPSMKVLLVDGNNLEGTIPSSLCNNSKIKTLYLMTPLVSESSRITCYPECLNDTVDTLSTGNIPVCSSSTTIPSNHSKSFSIDLIILGIIVFVLVCLLFCKTFTGEFKSNSKVTPLLPQSEISAAAVGRECNDRDSDDTVTEADVGMEPPRIRVIPRINYKRTVCSVTDSFHNNMNKPFENINNRDDTQYIGRTMEYPFRGVSLTRGETELRKNTPNQILTTEDNIEEPGDSAVCVEASSNSVDIRVYSRAH